MPTRHCQKHLKTENGPLGPAKSGRTRQDSASAAGNRPSALDHEQTRLESACHELRQPLQSLVLLHALLARSIEGPARMKLLARIDAALSVMTAAVARLEAADACVSQVSTASPARASADVVTSQSSSAFPAVATASAGPTVFVVDDDAACRGAIASVLEAAGFIVLPFESCEAFMAHNVGGADGCVLVDAYLPGMSGLALLQKLQSTGSRLPAIMITGNSDVPMAVQAMKAGAVDFIEKPVGRTELLECIHRAVEYSRDQFQLVSWQRDAATHVASLTSRQREIMDMVLAGQPSKNIAADLGISQRTVENHRASIMKRTGAKSLPALARLAVAAASITGSGLDEPSAIAAVESALR